jgi:hypothetical protein
MASYEVTFDAKLSVTVEADDEAAAADHAVAIADRLSEDGVVGRGGEGYVVRVPGGDWTILNNTAGEY